jgi:hypothetical protein
VWLVRSPWPMMTVADVIWIHWPWVEREPFEETDFAPRVAEVFAWSERQALKSLADRPPGARE